MNTVSKQLIVILLCICCAACGDRILLNSEADITEVIVPARLKTGLPIITNNTVTIPRIIESDEDEIAFEEQLGAVELSFRLTEGATIVSRDGKDPDFRDGTPHVFTVTSEDGKWTKDYIVEFSRVLAFSNTELHFENVRNNSPKPYHIFYEIDDLSGVQQDVWSSGNEGFSIMAGNKPAADYPTFSFAQGKSSKGVQLVTRSTGFPAMPIAAGNLFLGSFDMSKAMTAPLEATSFGVKTAMKRPIKIQMWGKYKAGTDLVDGAIDQPDVYAVYFEPKRDVRGNPIMLNGKQESLAADNIVRIARLKPAQRDLLHVPNINTSEYQFIEIEFEDGQQPFDEEKQMGAEYYFTIVFSASAKGGEFKGAIGSTFCLDEVKIITE